MPQLTELFLAYAAVAVALHWALPERMRDGGMVVAGTALLALHEPVAALVLPGVALLTYAAAQAGVGGQRAALFGLIVTFCAVRFLGLRGVAPTIGIAFFLPRMLHYVVEHGRGKLRTHGLSAFLAWALFFPALLVGPIHRADSFFRDRARRRPDAQRVAVGLRRILMGYAKVVIVANYLVSDRNLYVNPAMLEPGPAVLFECLQYGLYLYFMFAGCSDIAVGLARLHGHRIEENFNWPLFRRNLSEFWQAWHMTLSWWCRTYVFLPIFARTRNAAPALIASMVVLGLWHEFSSRYLLWGLWHGVGLAVHRGYESTLYPRLPALPWHLGALFATALTWAYVMLSFVITKNDHLEQTAADLADLARWITP
jgi:D-alanyl-lipoteichoic acid acyltransferase DltB (MBOAT superfamily)